MSGFLSKAKLAYNVLRGNGIELKSFGSGMQMLGSSASFTSPTGYNLAADGYNANSIAYYCVNLVASACALVPLRVYRRKMTKDGVVYDHLPDHEANKFIRQPNACMSGQRYQHAMHVYQLVMGNNYILARFRNAQNLPVGKPFEFDLLRPDRMTIKENNGIATGYAYQGGSGVMKEYPINPLNKLSPVLHLKDFNPIDDFYGMASLQPASKQIDISNQAARYNKSLLDNGARLTMALRLSPDIDAETIDNTRNEFLKEYGGAMNAGRPFIMNDVDEIKELGITPRDMEFSDAQLNSFRLIANAVGVPTYMLGLRDTQSTFNNMQEAKTFFYQTTVSQRLTYMYGDTDGDIEGEINLYLQKFYGDDIVIKPYWDKVDALASVREKRYERAKNLAGIATIDEQREMVGLEALGIDGVSNIPWRGTGEAPISFAENLEEVEKEDPKKPKEDDKQYDDGVEFKLINDRSDGARQRELALFARFLNKYERKLAPKMARMINNEAKIAAGAYQLKGKKANIDAIFDNSFPHTLAIYEKHYKDVMRFFGNRVMDAFGKGGFMMLERKETDTVFDMSVRRFIELYGADEVRLQSDTTKALIKEAILRGEKAGLTNREISKSILTAAGGAVSRRRSLVIAETETHAAANYAQKHGAIAATGEDSSEWVSAEDSRTRASHASVDGTVVKDGKEFSVGGYKASYPGDPKLPAKERVRCRCTLVFSAEQEDE